MKPKQIVVQTLALNAVLAGAALAQTNPQPAAVPPVVPPAPVTSPTIAPATLPTTSPFDAVDPEIRAVGRLNWRDADFEKLDLQAKGASLVALNRFLDVAGSKADARAELLVDYLDKNDLGSAYTADAAAEDPGRTLTFNDARKIAAAFITSPQGQQKFGDEFTKSPPQDQQRYLDLYEKTCLRKFDDAAESRGQVRLMARFLDKQGKLDDFQRWAAAETDRRQREHDAELAQKAKDQADADERRRAVVAAEREQALAARKLDYAYQQERYASEDDQSRRYDDYGTAWSPNAYYYGDAYRTIQRRRMVVAYAKWNAGNRGGGRPAPRSWSRGR